MYNFLYTNKYIFYYYKKMDGKSKDVNILAVNYTDYSDYYSIYGIITLIFLMLLLWFFIRTTVYDVEIKPKKRKEYFEDEPLNIPADSDSQYKFGPLQKGIYGDVPVYFYETIDDLHAPDWRQSNEGIYVHNAKTYWKDVNTPIEANYWSKEYIN